MSIEKAIGDISPEYLYTKDAFKRMYDVLGEDAKEMGSANMDRPEEKKNNTEIGILPNFICPGAMKSGTSTLYKILSQHPDIYMPYKEIRYFSRDHWGKGCEWYLRQFSNHNGEEIVGEMSPQYMFTPEAPERIYQTLGSSVKFIFMLRNPAERAYSHYRMHKRYRLGVKPFDIITEEEIRGEKKDIIHKGLYASQIKRFLNFFPIGNMKFVLFENFVRNQKQVAEEIFDFLGVNRLENNRYDLHEYVDFMYKHEKLYKAELKIVYLIQKYIIRVLYKDKDTKYKKYRSLLHKAVVSTQKSNHELPKPPTEVIRKLLDFYLDDIEELERIVGINLDIWKTVSEEN